MSHTEKKGLHLCGSISVVLINGDVLQGTFLGFAEERNEEAPFLFLPPKGKNDNNEKGEGDCQFLLLKLACAFSVFPVDSKVAVNIAQILVIGSGNSGCAPGPAPF